MKVIKTAAYGFRVQQRSTLFAEFPQYKEQLLRLAHAVHFQKTHQQLDPSQSLDPPMFIINDPNFNQPVAYLPQHKAIVCNDAMDNPSNYAIAHEYRHYLDHIFEEDMTDLLPADGTEHPEYAKAKTELAEAFRSRDPDRSLLAWMRYHSFPSEYRALVGGISLFVMNGMTEDFYLHDYMGVLTPNSRLSPENQNLLADFLKKVYRDAKIIADHRS